LSNDEIERLERLTLLKDYLEDKVDAIEQWNGTLGAAGDCPANRRQLTNLGTFRAYVANYLKGHPRIRRDMTCMARQLPLTAEGIPLELYCFTDTTTWVDYEAIQSDLFDHLIAVLPEFGLRVYQHPSGFDMRQMVGAAQAGLQAPHAG
ncbi:TPA: mechanosensitive ion channel family protein, partial [Burkholderia contaminans]